MNMSSKTSLILSSLILLGVSSVSADSTLPDAVRTCKKIANNAERLSCFDALLPDQKLMEQSSTHNQKQYSEDDFGAEDLTKRTEEEQNKKQQTLTSGLLEFGTNRSGKYFFILSNGQTWMQVQSETYKLFLPKKLDDINVVIKRSFIGAHTLRIEGKKRSIKVKRLR